MTVEETPGGAEEEADRKEPTQSKRIRVITGHLQQKLKVVQAEEDAEGGQIEREGEQDEIDWEETS